MVPSDIRWLFIFLLNQIWFVEFVFSAEIFYRLGPSNSCSGKHFICCFSMVPDVFASLTDLSLNICVWDETRSLIIVKHLMKAQNNFSIGMITSKIEKKVKDIESNDLKMSFFFSTIASLSNYFLFFWSLSECLDHGLKIESHILFLIILFYLFTFLSYTYSNNWKFLWAWHSPFVS